MMLGALCALGFFRASLHPLRALQRFGGTIHGLLWGFKQNENHQPLILDYQIPPFETASFPGFRYLRWLSRLLVTPQIRAVATNIVIAWSVASWSLLLITIIFPRWWPSGWWKVYVEEQLDDNQERQDATWREHPRQDAKNKEEQELPKDSPYGLLLLLAYGVGLWCGLWFAYMITHRALVWAVSLASGKIYDCAVVAMLDSASWPIGPHDTGEGLGAPTLTTKRGL